MQTFVFFEISGPKMVAINPAQVTAVRRSPNTNKATRITLSDGGQVQVAMTKLAMVAHNLACAEEGKVYVARSDGFPEEYP